MTILGYRPEEMIGHSAVDFIHPDDLDNTREEMRTARRGRQMRNFDTRYVHKDGHAVMLSWMGAWSEPVKRHFFVGRDLTEKQAAEAQFRQAQKMEAVGQLTGGVAHDFNNILTVITGTIGILTEAVAHDPQLAAIARMIDDAAERGANLTQHLLAFARKQPLQPREVDVNALVLETAKLLRPTLGEQIEIAPLLAADAWTALVDPSQLTTAILNLALNARDAMPYGGKLTLESKSVYLDDSYAEHAQRGHPGRLCHGRGKRHRRGDIRRQSGKGLRSLLHHQGGRQGHRPWPQHGVRLRQAVGRAYQDLQRGRPRDIRQALSAARHRARSRCRRAAALRRPSRAGTRSCLSSRTTRWCANMSLPRSEVLAIPRWRRATPPKHLMLSTTPPRSTCCLPT